MTLSIKKAKDRFFEKQWLRFTVMGFTRYATSFALYNFACEMFLNGVKHRAEIKPLGASTESETTGRFYNSRRVHKGKYCLSGRETRSCFAMIVPIYFESFRSAGGESPLPMDAKLHTLVHKFAAIQNASSALKSKVSKHTNSSATSTLSSSPLASLILYILVRVPYLA